MLKWNNQGAIRCEKHSPFIGSDTYVNEAWKRIGKNVVAENGLKCEVCGGK